MNTIIPSLWFDGNAYEAMLFYCDIFPNSEITRQDPVVVRANLNGVSFIGINGGPYFKPNASISFMVICETKEEIETIWHKLNTEDKIFMPLSSYPWSPYYGWLGDKYGFTWQLYLGKPEDVNQQLIVPTLLFSQKQQGKCQAALDFYSTLFKDYNAQGVLKYNEGEMEGQIQHTQFTANGFTLMAMDSGVEQDYTFNEAISLTITCKNQEEIDYYWDTITKNGLESRCGWCKDEFGISWQIVPHNIDRLLARSNANQQLLSMKKIEIAKLVHG